MSAMDRRRCARCRAPLAMDNGGGYCTSCESLVAALRRHPPVVLPPEFWNHPPIQAAAHRQHMGNLVAAYRRNPHHGSPIAQEIVGEWAGMSQTQVSRMETGPPEQHIDRLRFWATLLHIPHDLLWFEPAPGTTPPVLTHAAAKPADHEQDMDRAYARNDPRPLALDAESEAIELARRIEASDVSSGTLTRLQHVADRMAMAYAATPPAELLSRVRRHLGYVTSLTDARMTLSQRRTLLITGGGLALLAATLHVDLRQGDAADAWLVTAEQMAGHANYDEITAWCYETRAWNVLTIGRYRDALELSQRAQAIAPVGSSALIQATAQEGRAWARMKRPVETRDALTRVAQLVNNLPTPENPEHHYRYDPAKAISYTATTLAWVGDPAAEEFARTAIKELVNDPGGVPRPRRIASARLDLGLALIAANKPDEATAEALTAVTSGRIVPSNWWRATEVLHGVEQAGIPEANDLRDAYRAYRPTRPTTSA
ncbi:transcriptional regulator [Dactylosporangium sp. CA-233914]|uniref:transcriptional regulator n=1 Tax=Dactylosporangium sp. CA-233914 TaxID=3239934 RepID=UPI003D8AC293